MKIKNLFLVTFIFSFTLFFTSCDEDFLVKSDPGSGTVDGFFQTADDFKLGVNGIYNCLLYTSPSPRDATLSRMPSSA